jgi:uncharacterized protein YbcC (UPF0753/DUF2309 family)
MNASLTSKWSEDGTGPSEYRAARVACSRVAPLFDLRDMVAVNPFLGFADLGFFEASLLIEKIFHEEVLPPSEEKREIKGPRVFCVADRGGESEEIYRRAAPLASLTKFLSVYLGDSEASPWLEKGSLYRDYLEFVRFDRTPEASGLPEYSSLVRGMPTDYEAAFSLLTSKLSVKSERLELYFSRLLARIPGYSGVLRAQAFHEEESKLGGLPELLTILLLQDFALAKLEQDVFGPTFSEGDVGYLKDRTHRYQTLLFKEKRMGENFARRLKVETSKKETHRAAQLVFCIDVRSERYRKNLERVSDAETYGFAGFFGIPMGVTSADGMRPHCPALLTPQMTLASAKPQAGSFSASGPMNRPEQLTAGFYQSLTGPVSSLSAVEASGLAYLFQLVRDALPKAAPLAPPEPVSVHLESLSLEQRVGLAQSILKNTALKFPLAPLVVFVGHNSQVTNNPQVGGLACGACGGHSGAPNAQVAAALLNDGEVRAELGNTPYRIQDDVLFLAAEHETVTDSVWLFEPKVATESQKTAIADLRRELSLATTRCQDERFYELPEKHRELFYRRTRDYAETQPEWGLAGNSIFLVGRRDLSQGVSLRGAAFLHSYDEAQDEDGSILEMILTAPAVVTSWINLQYYASTVAPRCFGSGRKTLHNLIGRMGVVEGGQGDLAVGLSRESVIRSDDTGPLHEPLRIHVMVEAAPERIHKIVSQHPSLRKLVQGEWLHLSALGYHAGKVHLSPVRPEPLEGAT